MYYFTIVFHYCLIFCHRNLFNSTLIDIIKHLILFPFKLRYPDVPRYNVPTFSEVGFYLR